MSRVFRYATIGTGWIAEEFIKGTAMHGKATLAAVYSRTAEKGAAFAARYGCDTVYTDSAALAADPAIDAVYIASPNVCHAAQTRQMLLAGKHVICEKPATVTPQENAALQALARERGLIYMEALMAQHLPQRQILLDAVRRVGRVSHAHFDFSQRSSKYDSYMSGHHENIFDPKMATGSLMDLGVYCVYPAVDLFGRPQSVSAFADFLPSGADGCGGAVLEYDGFHVLLTYSKTGQSIVGSELVGDAATLVIPTISKLLDMKLVFRDGREEMLTGSAEKAALMRYESEDFFRYIADPAAHREELARLQALSLAVAEVMADIREKAGIRFDL